MNQQSAIGIDIGGTNTVFGLVNARGDILYRGAISTKNNETIDDFINALYAAILAEARALGLPHLHVLASRCSQGFFLRHGWRMAPELTDIPGLDPRQGPHDNPVNKPMAVAL